MTGASDGRPMTWFPIAFYAVALSAVVVVAIGWK
jgi:hypothetical protein